MNKECYLKGVRLLTQKEYSRPKLKHKLTSAGYDPQDAQECVDQLFQKGLLKEEWYIESRIKALMRKSYSASHIQQRLEQEELNVGEETIQRVFSDYGHKSEGELLAEIISKKAGRWLEKWHDLTHEERQKITVKLVRTLTSKGYRASAGLKAVEHFFAAK